MFFLGCAANIAANDTQGSFYVYTTHKAQAEKSLLTIQKTRLITFVHTDIGMARVLLF